MEVEGGRGWEEGEGGVEEGEEGGTGEPQRPQRPPTFTGWVQGKGEGRAA